MHGYRRVLYKIDGSQMSPKSVYWRLHVNKRYNRNERGVYEGCLGPDLECAGARTHAQVFQPHEQEKWYNT
jgi:hypothetical protein